MSEDKNIDDALREIERAICIERNKLQKMEEKCDRSRGVISGLEWALKEAHKA